MKIFFLILPLASFLLLGCVQSRGPRNPVYSESVFQAPVVRPCNGQYQRSPSAVEFYVSLAGNDLGSGSQDQPFKTISRAQKAVRKINSQMDGDIVVNISEGTYYLKEPLEFTESDSGSNGFKVIYKNTDARGSARIVGGVPVKNWIHYSDNIYVTRVPSEWDFYSLFENDIRAEEARFPNKVVNPKYPLSHGTYLLSPGVGTDGRSVQFFAGDLPKLSGDSSRLRAFVWGPPGGAWFPDIVPVESVDEKLGKISLAQELRYKTKGTPRYFLMGALQFLDSHGEFYFDKNKGLLYYWPRNPEIAKSEIIVPLMKRVLSLKGSSPSQLVHDLVFDGITFEDSDFTDWYRFGWPRSGDSGEGHVAADFDRQIEMPQNREGLFRLENTRNIDFVFSHIRNSGFNGVYALFANSADCFYGDLVEDSGMHGISCLSKRGDISRENIVSNTLVRHVGEVAPHGSGIDVSNSGNNRLTNLLIQGSSRAGVMVHVGTAASGENDYAVGNLFENIKVFDVTQDSGDVGALYTFGLSQKGPIRSNKFENIYVKGIESDPTMKDWTPVGVFNDADSSIQIFKNIFIDGTTFQYRAYTKPHHVFRNVSWLPGFDLSKIDLQTIGIKSDFPEEYLNPTGEFL